MEEERISWVAYYPFLSRKALIDGIRSLPGEMLLRRWTGEKWIYRRPTEEEAGAMQADEAW